MRDLFTVMTFTMKDMIKRKSFIVSTIIILLFIVIGFNVPRIIKLFKEDNISTEIVLSDPNNIYEGVIKEDTEYNGYKFKVITDDLDSLRKKVASEEEDSAIFVSVKEGVIYLTYVTTNSTMMGGSPDDYLADTLVDIYKTKELNKLDVSEEVYKAMNPAFAFDVVQATDDEVKGNVLAMMLMSIVLFYAVYFCAYGVSSSITTEKTSKIIETLVTSTSPRNIVLGKTLGLGIVGLGQLCIILITAIASAKLFLDPTLIDMILDVSSLTPFLFIMTLVYFILGYSTYALLYALTGSTVSKPEDIQSANSPVAMITLVGFYLSYFTMTNPYGSLNAFASILPISSPFCMPFRIMMGLASTKEVVISILVLVLTILFIAHITIKIYSNAILNYGSKFSIKDIIKMYKQK